MRRVGVVGCGFIGRAHSWALWASVEAGLVDARVVSMYDPDPERAAGLARPHGAEVAPDLDALLDAVDVVYICTPTATHLALVEAAATRGLAVFCEKPLAPTLEGAEALAAMLERVPHQVGLVLRHSPALAELDGRIRSGAYGRVMTSVLRDDQFFPNQGHYASTWRGDREVAGGGTLIEHSIHDLDVLRWLHGEVGEVSCATASHFGHDGVEDLATVRLGFGGGVTSTLVSVWHQVLSRPSTRRLEVFCERAYFQLTNEYYGPLVVETSDAAEEVSCEPPAWVDELPVPEAVRRALGPYVQASLGFLGALEGWPGAAEALAAHRLVDAAYRSAASGGAVVAVSRPGGPHA